MKVCNAVKRNISPDECIKSVAVFLTQPALCERITGRDFKYENPPKAQCYSDIAVETNDVELCSRLEGGFISASETTCLAFVAQKHGNAAACVKIMGEESRLGSVMNKGACLKLIGKTEADATAAPPKKGPTSIVFGLGAGALNVIAYILLGAWAFLTIRHIARKKKKTPSA